MSRMAVGAAVIQPDDVALLESGDGEVAALVEASRAAEAQHRAAGTCARHLLPFQGSEIRRGSRAAGEEQRRSKDQRDAHIRRVEPPCDEVSVPGAARIAWRVHRDAAV